MLQNLSWPTEASALIQVSKNQACTPFLQNQGLSQVTNCKPILPSARAAIPFKTQARLKIVWVNMIFLFVLAELLEIGYLHGICCPPRRAGNLPQKESPLRKQQFIAWDKRGPKQGLMVRGSLNRRWAARATRWGPWKSLSHLFTILETQGWKGPQDTT